MENIIAETYKKCKAHPSPPQGRDVQIHDAADICNQTSPPWEGLGEALNHVRAIYAPFTVEEINAKIVEMLRPKGMQAPIELVFQSIVGLHEACANHPGDWYFTGHYPTPGGVRLCNAAFVDFVETTLRMQL